MKQCACCKEVKPLENGFALLAVLDEFNVVVDAFLAALLRGAGKKLVTAARELIPTTKTNPKNGHGES